MDRAQEADVRQAEFARPGTAKPGKNGRAGSALWVAYGLLGLYLASYLASLIAQSDNQWPLFSDGAVGVFELLASAMCLARGFTRRAGHVVAFTLGLGLLLWGLLVLKRGGAVM